MKFFSAAAQQRMKIKTNVLEKVFSPQALRMIGKETVRLIKKMEKQIVFDTIAFTGLSGAALAFILSYETGYPLFCLRKEESGHWDSLIEGNINLKNYIIVDDFIATGDTVNKLISEIDLINPEAKCQAIITYSSSARDGFLPLHEEESIPVYHPSSKVLFQTSKISDWNESDPA